MSEEESTPGSDTETVEDSLGELVLSYRRPRGRGGVGGEVMGLARRYSQIVSKLNNLFSYKLGDGFS